MGIQAYDLGFMAEMLLINFMVLLVMATGGTPLVALVAERLGIAQKRVFLDKFASQITTMGVILGLSSLPFAAGVWFMGWGGSWLVLYLKDPNLPLPPFSLALAGQASLLTAGFYVLTLCLLLLYKFTWKSLSKSKTLHSLLGILATLAGFGTLFLFVLVQRMKVLFPDVHPADQDLSQFFTSLVNEGGNSAFWPLFGVSVGIIIVSAAALGLVYMVLRRKKDDYGRDYYNYGLKHCATWAVSGATICLALGGWVAAVMFPELLHLELGAPKVHLFAIGLLCMVIACICWGLVRGSQTPLRHKPAIFLGATLLLAALHCQVVSLILTM